ncbi:MAG: universal stress protein [Alphaproteobacteria bacterium]|nr:universal stress protein [Alphaproteobacteria bacterium]
MSSFDALGVYPWLVRLPLAAFAGGSVSTRPLIGYVSVPDRDSAQSRPHSPVKGQDRSVDVDQSADGRGAHIEADRSRRMFQMNYHNILVLVDAGKASKARLAVAIDLARRCNASLTGVFLSTTFLATFGAREAVAFMTPEDISRLLDEQVAAVSAASARARTPFESAVREAGVPCFWEEVSGDGSEYLIAAARRHDLSILPSICHVGVSDHVVSAAEVGMACGSPVLVAPEGRYQPPAGRRVLIAWKDSREAARALNDAWPILCRAETIQVLKIGDEVEAALDPMLLRQLALHGCPEPHVVVDRDSDASTGEILRRHIGVSGADLVVMGLYGHSRLREIVLGGVSRDLLHDTPAALLMSH